MSFFTYFFGNFDLWLQELFRHIAIVLMALPLAILIGVPLGIKIASHPKMANWVLRAASILMTIPSLALFGIMIVLLAPLNASLGAPPAVITMVLYSMLPIIRNTMVAVQSVDPAILEAARGMGMTRQQVLLRIRLPLSLPILIAGVRTVVVMGTGVVTMAQLVGAGGLGNFVFTGLARSRMDMVLLGSISVGGLGIGLSSLLTRLEVWLSPRGLKISQQRS